MTPEISHIQNGLARCCCFFCGSYVKMNVDMSTESNIQSLMLINPYKTQQEHLKNRHAYVVTLGCIMNNWL